MFPLCPTLVRIFIIEFYWMLFFHLLRRSCMWWITLIDSRMLTHLCEPVMNPTGLWFTIFSIVGFGLLIFCWELLHVYSSKVLVCYFLFWWYLCFWYQGDGNFIERKCFLLFSLLKEFEKDSYKFFVCLEEFTHEAIWLWTFVCREFFFFLFFSFNYRFLLHV